MTIKKVFFIFLFGTILSWQSLFCQKIAGKIVAATADIDGVMVVNRSNESSTITKNGGFFYIDAKVGDELVFSAVNLLPKKKILLENDFKLNLFLVRLEIDVNYLDPVEVNRNTKINAVSLGILQKQPKNYTPAERKLKVAGDFKPIQLLLIPFGGMPFDQVLNAISGRTKMLKKELETERKEQAIAAIADYFKADYFTEKLKIESVYITGFKYFLAENNQFMTILKSKNKLDIEFEINKLAVEYIHNNKESK